MPADVNTILRELYEEYDIPSECSVIAKSGTDEYYSVKYDRSFEDYLQSITDRHVSVLLKNNMREVKRFLQNWKKYHILLVSIEDSEEVYLFSDSKLKIMDNWVYIEEDDTDYNNIYTDWYPRYRESSIYEDYFSFEEDEEDW